MESSWNSIFQYTGVSASPVLFAPEVVGPGDEVLPGDEVGLVQDEDQTFTGLTAGHHGLLHLQTSKKTIYSYL